MFSLVIRSQSWLESDSQKYQFNGCSPIPGWPEKRATSSRALFRCLSWYPPLVSEEHQPWHAKHLLRLEDSQVYILNGVGENRRGFIWKMSSVRINDHGSSVIVTAVHTSSSLSTTSLSLSSTTWTSLSSPTTSSSMTSVGEDSKTGLGTRPWSNQQGTSQVPVLLSRKNADVVSRTSSDTYSSELRPRFSASKRWWSRFWSRLLLCTKNLLVQKMALSPQFTMDINQPGWREIWILRCCWIRS